VPSGCGQKGLYAVPGRGSPHRDSVVRGITEQPCSDRSLHRTRRGVYLRLIALKMTRATVAACGAHVQYQLHDGRMPFSYPYLVNFLEACRPPSCDARSRTIRMRVIWHRATCTSCSWLTVVSFHTSSVAHLSPSCSQGAWQGAWIHKVQRGESRVLSHDGHVPNVNIPP